MFGLAVSMTRNYEDAADMAQDAFIRAYSKLEQYNPDYSFRSWILRICANLTKNLFRSRARRRNMEERHRIQMEVGQDAVEPDFQALEEALVKLGVPLRLQKTGVMRRPGSERLFHHFCGPLQRRASFQTWEKFQGGWHSRKRGQNGMAPT